MASKGTETDSDYHQLIGTLRKNVSLLKDEIRNKQVTIGNLIGLIKNLRSSKINIQKTKNKISFILLIISNEISAALKRKKRLIV